MTLSIAVFLGAVFLFFIVVVLLERRTDRKAKRIRTAIEFGPLARALNDAEREHRRSED